MPMKYLRLWRSNRGRLEISRLATAGRRALAVRRHHARNLGDAASVLLDRFNQLVYSGLALTFENAVDRTVAVLTIDRAVNDALWPPTQTKQLG